MKKTITTIIVSCLGFASVFSQQLPIFTQYRENLTLINPGAIDFDYLRIKYQKSFSASYRLQWAKLQEHAPETIFASYNHLPLTNNAFYGGNIVTDRTGAISTLGVYGRFGYQLYLTPNRYHVLSLGISAGFAQYRIKLASLSLTDPGDVTASRRASANQWASDFGIGAFYYYNNPSTSKFYIGLSVPQLIQRELVYKTSDTTSFKINRLQHLYGVAGFLINVGELDFIEPSIWLKHLPNTSIPYQVDLNIRYQLRNVVWFGVGISNTSIMNVELGVTRNNFNIGTGFSYRVSAYGPYFGNTYEVNLKYLIP